VHVPGAVPDRARRAVSAAAPALPVAQSSRSRGLSVSVLALEEEVGQLPARHRADPGVRAGQDRRRLPLGPAGPRAAVSPPGVGRPVAVDRCGAAGDAVCGAVYLSLLAAEPAYGAAGRGLPGAGGGGAAV